VTLGLGEAPFRWRVPVRVPCWAKSATERPTARFPAWNSH